LSIIEQILEVARWAPSPDNTQPWRFEITGQDRLIIYGFDTSSHSIYDLDGHASQIGLGTLLENITLAASGHGLHASFHRRLETPPTQHVFDVYFTPAPGITADPLIPYIPTRTVQRRALGTRSLAPAEKAALEAAVGPAYRLIWLEGFRNKLRTAMLMFHNAKLRLTMPEAYRVHKDAIEWNARFSHDRIPDQAVGLDPITTRLMQWVLQSWQRVTFFNRYLAGTWLARIEMDLLPGIACGAHFAILAHEKPLTTDDYVSAGRAVQRFWLTATQLGLQLQPETTPLIFARYLRNGIQFSQLKGIHERAQLPARRLRQLIGEKEVEFAVFMGRIGAGRAADARSLRLTPERLLTRKSDPA